MRKAKHKLNRSAIRNYPTVIAVIGRASKSKSGHSTKPMTRQKKKRFGIFKKSEE